MRAISKLHRATLDSVPPTAAICGAGVTGIGVSGVLGWLLGIEWLKSGMPAGFATMKFNTALCLMAAGVALILRAVPHLSSSQRRIGDYCAGLAFLVSGLTLAEYVFGLNLRVDQVFVRDAAGQVFPGRMSLATCAAILVSSIALIMPTEEHGRFNYPAALWWVVFLFPVAALLGYAINVEHFYRIGPYSSFAANTAVALLLLSIGGLADSGGINGPWLLGGGRSQNYRQYVLTAVIVLWAFWLRYVLGEVANVTPPYITFLPAVMLIAVLAGARAGYFATALSAVLAVMYFIEPVGRLKLQTSADYIGFALFAIPCLVVCRLTGMLYALRDREAEARAELQAELTERKLTEDMLAERNTQLELASRTALVGSYAIDYTKGLVNLSPGCAVVLGLPKSTVEISRDDVRKFVHPQDLAELLDAPRHQAFLKQESDFIVQFRIIRADDGEVRWVEARSFIVYDHVGQPLRLIAVIIDITERKRTEFALQASEAKLAGILAIAGDAIISIDANHQITLFNEAAERLFGYLRAEILGKPIDLLIPTKFRATHQLHILRFASGREIARRMADRKEVLGIRKNGEEFPTEASISKFKSGGEWVYTIVMRDVTERKRAEERQRALAAELDHRVKNVLASVTAIVAHTRQESKTVANFVEVLDGRISSMARTHELLSSQGWKGISLTQLARRELAPYAALNNTELNGPEVILTAEAGQTLAMVFHELATNAAKYGALSTKNGCVSVRWHRPSNGYPTSHLVLEWQETGGPPVVDGGKSGFGTSTIRDLIPYELGGAVDFVLAPEGVRCRLELPSRWLSNDREPVSEGTTDAA